MWDLGNRVKNLVECVYAAPGPSFGAMESVEPVGWPPEASGLGRERAPGVATPDVNSTAVRAFQSARFADRVKSDWLDMRDFPLWTARLTRKGAFL